jgi:FlgD Ig-like domain
VRRLPLVAFGALFAATVGAFFVTQHLKVTTPLIAGYPRPVPNVIDPYGARCGGVDHSRMRVSFYLLHRSDDVSVYIVDSSGTIVRTLASGRHMRIKRRILFVWNGREDNGALAPDGTYYVRVALLHQGRTVDISDPNGPVPVKVKTTPPHPVVTNVSPSLIPLGDEQVKIDYRGNDKRSGFVILYRTDLPGKPRAVKSFKTKWNATQAAWDGLIARRPAPAGTYLVGLNVTDAACNKGTFPALMPPAPGSTPNAGVTVRYLAGQPPLSAVPAGSSAQAYVDARGAAYRWGLFRVGARKPSGHGAQRSYQLRVKLPWAQGAGLYHLVIHSGSRATDVPLIADHPGRRHEPRVLVVLPALTWQGENPVDDPPRDGIPNTLAGGGPIQLARPLVGGLPAGFADQAAFLAYLDKAHLSYDLTTDLGLLGGVGPRLAGHAAIVLDGSMRWVPPSLGALLRSYVQNGGHLISIGTDSLLRGVTVTGATAEHPTAPAKADILGAQPGALVTGNRELITQIRDGLRIFSGTSAAFPGYSSFQSIRAIAPPGRILSEAGTANTTPAIVGYRLGNGTVVDIGLVGFGASLATHVDAKELVNRLWRVLGR